MVQLIIFIITIGIGVQFYFYVRLAAGQDPITIQRPPGVEGFLPIGALMGWKYFLQTGQWDSVHPAAMVIFGWAVLVSLLFRKGFCGWFCPVGTVSEWLWRIGRRLFGRNFNAPKWLDLPLRMLKYALLGFFVWAVSAMDADQIAAFTNGPYYKLSDVKMLFFFTRMSGTASGVLLGLVMLSFLMKNFWCRYLCPYGALLGLVAAVGPTRIRRFGEHCTRCRACERACASRLPVSEKWHIRSPECMGCMACIEACPGDETLAMCSTGFGRKFWSPVRAGVFIALFFALTVFSASLSGHWRGSVSDQELRSRIRSIDFPEVTHPPVRFHG
jgi:polyferredoxin